MEIELSWLFAIAVAYLGLLFLVAWCADQHWMPRSLISGPVIYSLSLGVFATSWTYYGGVGMADSQGYVFLTLYLGMTGAFLLGPYLLRPILRLCRDYQLTSIADLLAFRYGGRAAGFAVTLFMLLGIVPYISLQIRAVTESVQVLSQQSSPQMLALVFCILVSVFAILFGARHLTPREKHQGLVLAIAFESAVKLLALLIAGLFVVTEVFSSPAAMNHWAEAQPGMLNELYATGNSGLWSTLLLLAFCAALTLPRQYHMTFAENQDPAHLRTASWLFPLYLILLNLPIIPVLFAGRYLSLDVPADFYVLGIAQVTAQPWLAILVFIGGLSAASAMMIVTTLALSSMCMNHILLPATLTRDYSQDIYKDVLWGRRLIICLIIACGYGFHIIIDINEGLASLGLISFVAAAQLMPGIIGLLVWPGGTRFGFLLGLGGGSMLWFILLILPLLDPTLSSELWFPVATDKWTAATFSTLSLNTALFFIGSLITRCSAEEQSAAQAAIEQTAHAIGTVRIGESVSHYQHLLVQTLGQRVGSEELHRALQETRVESDETRSAELRMLHDQLERNLTGLLGPVVARRILSRHSSTLTSSSATDTRLLERRLLASREQMHGLTKQLDDLRQYFQSILRQLPLGICSLSADRRVTIWNAAMQTVTGITEHDACDQTLSQLNAPWGDILQEFADSSEQTRSRQRVSTGSNTLTITLNKATISSLNSDKDTGQSGQVIIMEDRTSLDTLESELAHNERLASIGRLAAGVAHEIGNPLTGIASIAQNLHHELNELLPSEHTAIETLSEQSDDILSQVSRINTIVRSLLTFSHADNRAEQPSAAVDASQIVTEALRLVRLSPTTRRLNFECTMPERAIVKADVNALMQVFVNLINNACDASPDGATVSIHGHLIQHELIIKTYDNGPGIQPAHREHIFEPFFTTKPVGQGTGLGLSLAYNIVNKHNGKLRIEDTDSGTCMSVSLPLYNAGTQAAR